MEKKYIIELPENTHWIQWIMEGTKDHHPYMDFKQVEDLTPYTEPDTEKVKEEAYRQGYDTGYGTKVNEFYEQGLADAWTAARKIAISEESGGLTCREMQRIFCTDEIDEIFDMSASEAIEGIHQYEQEQEEEQIQVWDEVKAFEGKPFIVTGFGYGDEDTVYCHGFVTENGISTIAKKDECVKTGRCFSEIAEVLRKMKEES